MPLHPWKSILPGTVRYGTMSFTFIRFSFFKGGCCRHVTTARSRESIRNEKRMRCFFALLLHLVLNVARTIQQNYLQILKKILIALTDIFGLGQDRERQKDVGIRPGPNLNVCPGIIQEPSNEDDVLRTWPTV